MNDNDFIKAMAQKWVELGGDSEGVAWSWKRLQEAVIEIEFKQKPASQNGIYSDNPNDNEGDK